MLANSLSDFQLAIRWNNRVELPVGLIEPKTCLFVQVEEFLIGGRDELLAGACAEPVGMCS